MGIQNGQVVQEFGDGGADGETLRAEIEHITGTPVLDADADDVVDVVLLWWREEDGDLADGVVDVLDALEDDGTMWVLTPKSGRDGHVSASDVDEAAAIAGLHVTSTNMVGNDWTAARLTAPKGTPKGT
ncbi:MAG: hypothetical protein CSA58_12430 [Micrococcales bacterium]|nr:MAG: hypothetical protein CSB46_06350 [Micrococcales bacterium]PIE25875.1 MAG: hypothetical protein CSA58_12430 [Micrococcales bacterium]